MAVTFSLDTRAVNALVAELGADIEAAVRPVAQAGAQVFYDQVVLNVAGIGKVTGNLAGSIYQVYSKDNSSDTRATYHVSWNHKKAPHGHLLEFGHWQRYAVYVDRAGQWKTAVRRGKKGRLARRASQAQKDAHYVPRAGGPRYIAARPFVRPAMSMFPAALAAMEARLTSYVLEGVKT